MYEHGTNCSTFLLSTEKNCKQLYVQKSVEYLRKLSTSCGYDGDKSIFCVEHKFWHKISENICAYVDNFVDNYSRKLTFITKKSEILNHTALHDAAGVVIYVTSEKNVSEYVF